MLMRVNPNLHKVASQLMEWNENLKGIREPVHVEVHYADYYEGLLMGDHILWDSEGNGVENLTFQACKEEFLSHITKLCDYSKASRSLERRKSKNKKK